MKKLFFSLVVVSLLLNPLFAYADIIRGQINDALKKYPINQSSAFQSTDMAMVTSACKIKSITVIAAASPGSVVLYDNASAASGTVLADISIATSGNTETWTLPVGTYLDASNGIFCDVTNASVRVNYE